MWTEEHRRLCRRGRGSVKASGRRSGPSCTALRERIGRAASPAAAVLDSQSVKSAEKGAAKTNQVGYDAGKQVKGRKIHALVNSEGLPMRVVVHSAALQDRDLVGPRQDSPALPLARTDLG